MLLLLYHCSPWCTFRVEQLLKERAAKAKAIASVYSYMQAFIGDVSDENVFQVSYEHRI